MNTKTVLVLGLATLVAGPTLAAETGVPRTSSGRPDLSGTFDSGTLTPLNRPAEYGDKLYMTPAEAKEIEETEAALRERGLAPSDADRELPPEGGAAPVGADPSQREEFGAGNVGGYNSFWVDRGSDAFMVDGKFRTSIIYDPPNGRQPAMTPKGMRKMADNFSSFTHANDGTAWWYDDKDTPGPFDGPEDLALAERCLLGFSAGPPMLPGLYNNFKRIVQTEDHVMILVEMVHDARIIRLDAEHDPEGVGNWLGDSVGHWEGDTLVVETRHFRENTGLYGGDETLELIERFERLPDGNLLYNFTVNDPTAWAKPWSGEYVWKASNERVYEYACHEGNHAMPSILKGARLLEDDKRKQIESAD